MYVTLAEDDAPDSAAEEKLSKSSPGKKTGPGLKIHVEGCRFIFKYSFCTTHILITKAP